MSVQMSIYDVDVEITVSRGDTLIAKVNEQHMAWMEIEIDPVAKRYSFFGMSGMELAAEDDDWISFERYCGGDLVKIVLSKYAIARTIGCLVEGLGHSHFKAKEPEAKEPEKEKESEEDPWF